MRSLLPASVTAALCAVLATGCAHHEAGAHRGGHEAHHRFDHAEEWAPRFEDPARDAWQKPDEVIAALALPKEARVADIGAATGYFPVRIARALPEGKVVGVDVERSMVEYLAARAQKEKLPNLQAVLGAPDDPKIAGPVDLILVVDTYHHVGDRPAYFRRLASVLAEGGRLAIIDFRPESKMGPAEKLPQEAVVAELKDAGYALVQEHRFLPDQYFLVFEPKR